MSIQETEEITFNCTHGTFKSNSNKILEDRFNFSDGTCGEAVYFWTGIDGFIIDLAKDWVNLKKKKTENEGAVISCKIKVPEHSIIDLSSFEMIKEYSNFILKKGHKNLCNLNKKSRITILKDFLETFTFESGRDYICYLTRHFMETDENFTFPVKIFGHPFCLVVKSLEVIPRNLISSDFTITQK